MGFSCFRVIWFFFVVLFFSITTTVEEAQLPRPGSAIGRLDSDAAWSAAALTTPIPVVLFANHVPNEPQPPAIQALRQARQVNADVILIGPRPHRHLRSLQIRVMPKEDFNETINWVKVGLEGQVGMGFGVQDLGGSGVRFQDSETRV